MVANSTLQAVDESNWLRGFANLFQKENREWWATRRWLLHAVLWTVMINGIIAFVVFVVPALLPQMEPEEAGTFNVVAQGVQGLFQLGTVGLAIGAVILAQDEILGERLSGVTEWILSKPVSRDAYVLSKLVANAIGVLILLVALQMTIAYVLISVAGGSPLPAGPYLIGFVGLALHTLFYLALTLMMGVLVEDRGRLLGVPMGVLFGGLLFASFLGTLSMFTPWSLTGALTATVLQLTMPVPVWIPLASTALLTAACVAVTLWKFRRLEF